MVEVRNVLVMLKADSGWVAGIGMARIVVLSMTDPGRWSVRRGCSIVEPQTGWTTLRWLQTAVAGIVAPSHRGTVVELVEERCTSSVARTGEIVVAFGAPENNRPGTAASCPASVELHIAVLARIQSLPEAADCLH